MVLPFFTVQNSSLDLRAVSRMMNILVHCIPKKLEANLIELLCYSSPIRVVVTATDRAGTKLTFSCTVAVNDVVVKTLSRMVVCGNTYTSAAQVCGVVYRHAVVFAPLNAAPTFAVQGPNSQLVTSDWPPVRVVSLAATLFMQTYSGPYKTLVVSARTTASISVAMSSTAVATTNLYVEYKAREVVVVINCVQPPQRAVHTLPFCKSLEFLPGELTTFRWRNTVVNNHDNLLTHTQQLWRLFVGVLS
jgi:hypothetical protein